MTYDLYEYYPSSDDCLALWCKYENEKRAHDPHAEVTYAELQAKLAEPLPDIQKILDLPETADNK